MTGTTVKDVMTGEVYSVRASTPLSDVTRILAGRGISALPVVEHDRDVVGVVSEADLLAKQVATKTRIPGIRSKADGRVAGDVMTSPAVTVQADVSLAEAARLMVGHRVKRLPVVDRYGKLTGIVSRADLVHAFVRTDEEIRDEIAALRPRGGGTIDVEVTDGIVTLRGRVERRSQIVLLRALVPRVAGVVDVVDEIEFGWDDEANSAAGAERR